MEVYVNSLTDMTIGVLKCEQFCVLVLLLKIISDANVSMIYCNPMSSLDL